MNWIWQKMGNMKRETEMLLRAAQNDGIKTNSIEQKIDNTPKKASIGFIVTELMQKAGTKVIKDWHDYLGNMTDWKL